MPSVHCNIVLLHFMYKYLIRITNKIMLHFQILHFSLFHYSSCCFTLSFHALSPYPPLMKISHFWWRQYFVWLPPHTVLARSKLLVSVSKGRSITSRTPWSFCFCGNTSYMQQHGHLPRDPSSRAAINRACFIINLPTVSSRFLCWNRFIFLDLSTINWFPSAYFVDLEWRMLW